jgi:hypothetical protein
MLPIYTHLLNMPVGDIPYQPQLATLREIRIRSQGK